MLLRDYQEPAVSALVTTRRGIVQSPAGSGKTIIAAAALDRWAGPRARLGRRKMRVAWVAHTTEQTRQADEALAKFPKIAEHAEVTVACYQAGLALAAFDLVILDECHHIAAEEFRKPLTYHDGWRWGLSATPKRADELQKDVFELIGPIVHVVEREALVAAGQLAKARVFIHTPNKPGEFVDEIERLAIPEFNRRKHRFRFSGVSEQEQKARCVWQFAQDIGIIDNVYRNNLIVSLARRHAEDSTLMLVGKIEHGEALSSQIPGSLVVHSKMGATKRRQAITSFANGELRCMIATSLADEGLDVPRANVLIMASAGRSAAKAEQRTGRVLRAFEGKTHGIIHDFMDVQHHFLQNQSRRRIAVFRRLGYEVIFAAQPELFPQ